MVTLPGRESTTARDDEGVNSFVVMDPMVTLPGRESTTARDDEDVKFVSKQSDDSTSNQTSASMTIATRYKNVFAIPIERSDSTLPLPVHPKINAHRAFI